MRKVMLRGFVLLAAVGLMGCGSQVDVVQDALPPPPQPPDDTPVRLGDSTTIHLADWISQPRAELADLVVQWSDTVQKQRQHAQENPLSIDLLPGLQAPGTMPVFHEANYSPKAGFSLPPYLRASETDPAVALHLARLGDSEAALKIADPTDKDLLYRIDARHNGRNYPLEWTQLTALAFQSAEWKLATGDPQAATDILQMHKQLRDLLDDKAASGPLGAALLPLGRRALAEAVVAWKRPTMNKALLAGDVETALKQWGESPPPALALAPGASQFEAVRLFGRPATGLAVAADKPEAVARALDLLELPVPDEGVRAVLAFFDSDKRLTETLVLYRPNSIQSYPDPVNLAHSLVNHALPGDDPVKGVGLTRRTYDGDGLKYEAAVFSRGSALGGFVRIAGAKTGARLSADSRDFGAVHLDRTHEQNRVQFARDKTGSIVELDCRKYPGVLRLPIVEPVPDSAVLEREKEANLTSSLAVRWAVDEIPTAATKLAAPLLTAYGPARIDGVAAPEGDYLAFVWEDARTRLTLRLPYEMNPPVFKVENLPGSEAADALVRAAEAYDQAQRKTRLEAGKPLHWLPRSQQLPEIQLGMTKKQVLENLPRRASIDQQNLKGDLSLVFHEEPAPDATYFVRQMFLRFGPDDRMAEIRARYQEGPGKSDGRHASLLASLKKTGGEPRMRPAPWAGLWADLSPQDPKPALYQWSDDVTVLTCQRDGGGAETILRDWRADQTLDQAAEALPPLRFCDEGASGVLLGQSRADVIKRFPKYKPLENEDAVALAADSPYETLAVWFDSGKVVRVVAQHEAKPANSADISAKMQEAWMRDFDRLGALRRQDGPWGPVQQAYSWHDDKVRVRLLAQETADGTRLFTEWRYWPVGAKR
jgi:hypothetical protein